MSQDDGDSLAKLSSLLDTARGIAREMLDDEPLNRLLDAFARMPEGDREVVIGAIEREVRTRVVSQDVADDLTHVGLRPNPNARLYLRVVEPADRSDDVETLAFLRAAYSVQRGIDALDPQWRAMVLMVLRSLDPDARASIERFNKTIRELLEEAARLGPIPDPEPPAGRVEAPAASAPPRDASTNTK